MRRPSGSQSHLRQPLTRLFGSPGNVRVLRTLADGLSSSVTDVAAAAGLTPQGTRLVLDALVALGIVTASGSARTRLFELTAVHPLRQPVLALFEAERASWEALVAGLRDRFRRRTGIRAAWLYGSVARGEDTPASDVDIALLVSSADEGDQVRDELVRFEDATNVRVSVTALIPRDLAALPEDDAWWCGVIRDARVLKGRRPEVELNDLRARRGTA